MSVAAVRRGPSGARLRSGSGTARPSAPATICRSSPSDSGDYDIAFLGCRTESADGGSSFAVDDGNHGSQTASPLLTSLSYNKVDQTTSITPSGGSAYSLAYQGIGQTQRITNGSTTQTNDLLGLNNETGSPAATYFTRDADGTILGERRGTSSYYFLFDGLGSVVSVTDSSGNTADTFSYDPYGNITASTGTVYEPIRYAGGYDDSATSGHAGLVKFGQRYYDPTVGRWTQADPADASLNLHGWNQYDYTGDDPINDIDPTGLFRLTDIAQAFSVADEALGALATAGLAVGGTIACASAVTGVGAIACASILLVNGTASGVLTYAAVRNIEDLLHSHRVPQKRRRG